MKLPCPACKTPLDYLKTDLGYLWLCMSCFGQLVSKRNLEDGLEKSYLQELKARQLRAKISKDRSCPKCAKAMQEYDVGHPQAPLLIDSCFACGFYWFDNKEIEELPRLEKKQTEFSPAYSPEDEQEKELPEAARIALALHEVKRQKWEHKVNRVKDRLDSAGRIIHHTCYFPYNEIF